MYWNFNFEKIFKLIAVIITVLLGFFLFMLLDSCKSKKVSTEHTKLSDTIRTNSVEYVSRPITTNYQLGLECDSLGNVREVSKKETSGENVFDLQIKNNQLQVKQQTGESRVKTDTIYKTKFKKKIVSDEVVKYRSPLWHYYVHFLSGVMILVLLYFQLKRFIPFI
jgi:lipopolysaccharide export LptBFGC system permease protein LptF